MVTAALHFGLGQDLFGWQDWAVTQRHEVPLQDADGCTCKPYRECPYGIMAAGLICVMRPRVPAIRGKYDALSRRFERRKRDRNVAAGSKESPPRLHG